MFDGIAFGSAADGLTSPYLHTDNVAKILGLVCRAIAALELDSPRNMGTAFAAGNTYDFFKQLNATIQSAQQEVFVIDPYLDDEIFDKYLAGLPAQVSVRLLADEYAPKLKAVVTAFTNQYGPRVEIRTSKGFHDRVLFIDRLACWVVGQSIKDAAQCKPTYFLPLPADIAARKLAHYENVWSAGAKL